jgi:hypothetical protein
MKELKKISYLGAAVIGLLLITSTVSVIGTEQEPQQKTVSIVHKHATPNHDQQLTTKINTIVRLDDTQNLGRAGTDVPVATLPETENNPAIGAVPSGELLVSYTYVIDTFTTNVVWDFSLDKGQTWNGGIYYLIDGAESHPAIDYWGTAKKAVGTMQGDPATGNGADQHTLTVNDISDPTSYEGAMTTTSWGETLPYYDRRIPDIAGYDGNNIAWWFGIITCVGTRDAPGSVDMPIFNYANYVDESQSWSSYFGEYPGCENTAVEIDQTNGLFYAVFDQFNETRGDWDLLLFRGDCHDDGTGHINISTLDVLGGTENTKYPAVDVYDNKAIILAQTDESGTQDIVCYYTSDAGTTWGTSYVATDGAVDELYPKIVSYGETATCTFIKNNDLYCAYTEDGGATWSTPEKVNDETGSVDTEYRNTDITNDGTVVWADTRSGNTDVYLDNVAGSPASPILTLGNFAAGGIGKVSILVKNTGDADATDVSVTLTVTGGILGRIDKTVTQDIASLTIGQEVTVTTEGLIFGFGAISLSATATCTAAQPPSVTKTGAGKVILVFIRGIE